jgi:hypothetical protein
MNKGEYRCCHPATQHPKNALVVDFFVMAKPTQSSQGQHTESRKPKAFRLEFSCTARIQMPDPEWGACTPDIAISLLLADVSFVRTKRNSADVMTFCIYSPSVHLRQLPAYDAHILPSLSCFISIAKLHAHGAASQRASITYTSHLITAVVFGRCVFSHTGTEISLRG